MGRQRRKPTNKTKKTNRKSKARQSQAKTRNPAFAWLAVAAVLLVVGLWLFWWRLFPVSYPQLPVAELEQSLARAEHALAGRVARGDVIFLVTQAQLLTGRRLQPPMRLLPETLQGRGQNRLQATDYELWRMRDQQLPELRHHQRVWAERDLSVSSAPSTSKEAFTRTLALMVDVLGCGGRRSAWASVGEPGYGYVSAHQLLALLLARARNCLGQEELEQHAHRYIRRIYSEMLLHEGALTDLQVERMALLALAGRLDLVPQDQVEAVVAAQAKDGFWHLDTVADHSTALAYYLLSRVHVQSMDKGG